MSHDLRHRLPPLYSTGTDPHAIAQTRFFECWSGRAWYPVEFDGEEWFSGLIHDPRQVMSCFALSRLRGLRGPDEAIILRDAEFEPVPLSVLKERLLRASLAGPRPLRLAPPVQRTR